MKKKFLACMLIVTIFLTGCSGSDRGEKSRTTETDPVKTGAETQEVQTAEEEGIVSTEEAGETDNYAEKFSVYNNPIDEYFLPKIYARDKCEAEIRDLQDTYKKVWKAEFKNVIKYLQEKCVYDEDKNNIKSMEKLVSDYAEKSREVIIPELLDAYKVNPNPGEGEETESRNSYWGNGTRSRLNQIEGEIYRDASMRIIDVWGEETGYEFRKIDYSKVEVGE